MIRKRLIIGIGTAAVGLAMFAGVACGQPADKTNITNQQTPVAALEQQVQQFHHPLSEIPIIFQSYESENSIPEFVQDAIFQQAYSDLRKYYETLASRGLPSLPDGVSGLTIKLVEKRHLLPSTGNLEQKIQTAQRTTENMKEFLSDTGLKFPEVEFIVAQNSEEIAEGIQGKFEGSNIGNIAIYPIDSTVYNLQIEGEAKYGNQILPIEILIKARKFGGGIQRRARLTRVREGYNVEFVYGGILWAQQDSAQIVFETPALELLHAAVAPTDEQYAKQLIQNASTLEEARNAVSRSKLLNEYVVHGIGRHWFRKINDKLGLGYDMDELRQQRQVLSWWLDPNVDKMEGYVAKVGPARVIGMYMNSPEKLIVEAGLNMR